VLASRRGVECGVRGCGGGLGPANSAQQISYIKKGKRDF
jgi:hypothetical protein